MVFQERLLAKMRALLAEARLALDHVLAPSRDAKVQGPALDGSPDATPERDPAEAIHDLRVALRTLRSVLRPIQIVYGKRPLGDLEERLRRILDLTSELRDEEVLRETLGDLDLEDGARRMLTSWMVGRARRERGLRTRATRALANVQSSGRAEGNAAEAWEAPNTDVAHCLDELERVIARGPKHPITHVGFQLSALGQAIARLEKRAEASKIQDAASMHRVRIGAKRLRYVAELLGELTDDEGISEGQGNGTGPVPTEGRSRSTRTGIDRPKNADRELLARIAKSSARIQKRLGQLHDFDEALSRMGRAWGLDKEPRSEVLRALLAARRATADKASAELTEELVKTRTAAARLLDDRRVLGSVVGARSRSADEDATG